MHYSCPKCGNAAATLPALATGDAAAAAAAERTLQYKQQLGQLHLHGLAPAAATTAANGSAAQSATTQSNSMTNSTNSSTTSAGNGTGERSTVGSSSGGASTETTAISTAVSDGDTAVDKLLLALEAMFCCVIVLILMYKGLRFFGFTA
jgi:cobalamin biosynthesis Mg chelatase CobN